MRPSVAVTASSRSFAQHGSAAAGKPQHQFIKTPPMMGVDGHGLISTQLSISCSASPKEPFGPVSRNSFSCRYAFPVLQVQSSTRPSISPPRVALPRPSHVDSLNLPQTRLARSRAELGRRPPITRQTAQVRLPLLNHNGTSDRDRRRCSLGHGAQRRPNSASPAGADTKAEVQKSTTSRSVLIIIPTVLRFGIPAL